jgi:hypothetical protein
VSTELDDLLYVGLSQAPPAIGYYLSRRLSALFPDDALFEGTMPAFNMESYAAAGLCGLVERETPYGQRVRWWLGSEKGHLSRAHNTLFEATWEGEQLFVLITHWPDQTGPYHYFILARTLETAEAFHAAVCAWNTPIPDDYILVFDVNGWTRDDTLLAAIQRSTLDTLVLRGTLKRDILADLTSFFAARDTYDEYGVPWKRGILFIGPPGNGKTYAVKGLINALGQRCVYVKTFMAGAPDQFGIQNVFQQARQSAPCVLVLEDLDSLVTPTNRSYFLNELDGFAGNDGILTLATSNHPERLDPAILDRPSRFDRKYPFDLPELDQRKTYIGNWNETLRPALRLTDAGVETAAQTTDGFSFAYLKELFLSALMRWISAPQPGAMDAIIDEQTSVLREHMGVMAEVVPDMDYGPPGGFQPGHPGMFHRGMRGSHHGPQPTSAEEIPM